MIHPARIIISPGVIIHPALQAGRIRLHLARDHQVRPRQLTVDGDRFRFRSNTFHSVRLRHVTTPVSSSTLCILMEWWLLDNDILFLV